MPLTTNPSRKTDPDLWAIAKLDQAIIGMQEGDQLAPLDAVGIHAMIANLARTIDYRRIQVMISISPIDDRLDVLLSADDDDVSKIVDLWIRHISQMAHAPSGWTVRVYIEGIKTAIRSYDLPDWYVCAHDL